VKILVADPEKNITVFVLDAVENPEERNALAKAILEDSGIKAEQVGFVIPPTGSETALWRLEMAGGEFCGNAARSFGLYVARVKGLKGKNRFFISMSGMNEPLQVEVDPEHDWAAAEIPKPLLVETLVYNGRSLPLIVFEGITHIIAPDLEPGKENFFAIKTLLEKKFSGTAASFPAIGVMFYDTGSRFMRPAVYVPSAETLVFESSCGSGSAALGVWLSRGLENSAVKYPITQPGGIIETEVTKRAGEISSISIGGKVELGEPIQFP